MIGRGHALSVTKQAEAVGIARSTVYYLPRLVPAADLELMRQIDTFTRQALRSTRLTYVSKVSEG